jgi:hypothetical protein
MASIHLQLAQAIQAQILALDLTYTNDQNVVTPLPPAQVYLKEFPNWRVNAGILLPCVIVSKPDDSEREVGVMTSTDDIEWPVMITTAKATNSNLDWDDELSQWREAIAFSFLHERLAAVAQVMKCDVVWKNIVNRELFQQKLVSVGQMVIRPDYRRIRT